MSRFIIHINEQERKKNLFWARFYIAISLISILILIYYLFADGDSWRRALFICAAINFGWSGYNRLQKTKRREFFLEINEEGLDWLTPEPGGAISMQWRDIRWIKNEKNKAILISRESSFSVGFILDEFLEVDKIEIVHLLEKYAVQKNIRLVNFSETLLVPA